MGTAALIAWLALSPPRRAAPLSAGLQLGAALLLGLALLNAGWRPSGVGDRPTLIVLVDRSASMNVAAPGGATRQASAAEWLAGEAFSRWSAGWRVEVDSFGGATSDPAGAIETAAAALPGAILLVGDGRATGGRAAAAPSVPLFVRAPGPPTVADAAVLRLDVEEEDGGATAVIEVAAVGGEPTSERALATLVDGRVVARGRAPALAAGERRVVRVALPDPGPGERVVEARLEEPEDPVEGNDARAVVWRPNSAGRTLLAGLDPGWELGFLRRALVAAGAGPVDAVWSGRAGALRRVDGGAVTSWDALNPERYATLWLVGDPGLLGPAGRGWVARFRAMGGGGTYWAAGSGGGELSGFRAPAGGGVSAAPVLTDAGRQWIEALVGPGPVPDGSPAWPPIEGLPGAAVDLPAGARVLVRAGAAPIAWSLERDGSRMIVALGTGWYRMPLEGGDAGRGFWGAWTEAAWRWLAGASPAARPLVIMPPGGKVAVGEPLVVPLAEGPGPARWRVTPIGGGAEVASGNAEGDTIAVAPLPAGAWRLEVTADGRTETRALAVEPWTPDLARTEADTATLAAAARASGGGDAEGTPLPAAATVEAGTPGPVVGLGLVPWAFLLGALLVLGHWVVAARAR
ncbi:MAG TPA: hypothetical protein VMR66_04145 [Gemmatimonadota bacterium]|nr:hypothetical protein [Gemmatimonadota bacterium]